MSQKATIEDVAREAGVSIKTVSRAMNHEPNVREKTREKVLKAAEKLNYKPNISARMLAGDRTYLISMIYDEASIYNNNMQLGAMHQCREAGYNLIIDQFDRTADQKAEDLKNRLLQARPDGVIVTAPLSDDQELIDLLVAEKIPFVRVAPISKLDEGPCVYIDDQKAAYDMTMHLIESGHNDIAFIKGHPDHGSSKLRYDGFCEAMAEKSLPIRDDFLKQGYFTYRSGMEAAAELFEADHKPTAIFAADDDSAAGALAASHQYGLAVPNDISIVGYDDTMIAKIVWPSLTTIRQPLQEMAAEAIKLLLRLAPSFYKDNVQEAENRVILDFELMKRDSSAPNQSK